jgi:hypothetical protein
VVVSTQPQLEVGGGLPVGVTVVFIVLGALVALVNFEAYLDSKKSASPKTTQSLNQALNQKINPKQALTLNFHLQVYPNFYVKNNNKNYAQPIGSYRKLPIFCLVSRVILRLLL